MRGLLTLHARAGTQRKLGVIPSYGRIDQIFGPLAQWLEQGTHNPLVLGSNPRWPTFVKCVSGNTKIDLLSLHVVCIKQ